LADDAVKTFKLILSVLVAATVTRAESLDLDELFQEINDTVLTNLDVSNIDEAKLRDLSRELQKEFHGEHAVELAPIREAATALLPLMDEDVAAWVRTVIETPKLELPLPALPPPRLILPQPVWPPRPRQANWPADARVYVRQLKPIFVAEGVPAELVWLAEVESGFQPQARSRAGAAGLFQLMPETAELMGLNLRPVDDRLVPVKSGRAAAQYLKYLHDKFGDWALALAAYNSGEGRVRRLLEQYRASRFDEIADRLPPETQVYVPKVEATILRREGVALSELSPVLRARE